MSGAGQPGLKSLYTDCRSEATVTRRRRRCCAAPPASSGRDRASGL